MNIKEAFLSFGKEQIIIATIKSVVAKSKVSPNNDFLKSTSPSICYI